MESVPPEPAGFKEFGVAHLAPLEGDLEAVQPSSGRQQPAQRRARAEAGGDLQGVGRQRLDDLARRVAAGQQQALEPLLAQDRQRHHPKTATEQAARFVARLLAR